MKSKEPKSEGQMSQKSGQTKRQILSRQKEAISQ